MTAEQTSPAADRRSQHPWNITPGRFALYAGLSALLIATGGCSDPKAANDANFRKALEPVVKDRFCTFFNVRRMSTMAYPAPQDPPFPISIAARRARFDDNDDGTRAMLEQGVRMGVLKRTARTAPAREEGSTQPLVPTALLTYTPTEKGQQAVRIVDRKVRDGSMRPYPAACAATGTVTEIVRWTEPAAAFGRTLTEVTYRYAGKDFPDIVTPEERKGFEVPKEAKTVLVLANDGWQAVEK